DPAGPFSFRSRSFRCILPVSSSGFSKPEIACRPVLTAALPSGLPNPQEERHGTVSCDCRSGPNNLLPGSQTHPDGGCIRRPAFGIRRFLGEAIALCFSLSDISAGRIVHHLLEHERKRSAASVSPDVRICPDRASCRLAAL